MKKSIWASYVGSLSSLGVAACCVLPMTMILFGLGGSWLAIFGKIAAASYYVLGISTAVLLSAWTVSYRTGSISHLKWWLTGSTVLIAISWIVVVNEAQINDFLITLM